MTDKEILHIVALEYGVTESQIMSHSREQPIAEARQMYMYILRRVRLYLLCHIAEITNRSHPNVLWNVRQIKNQLTIYPATKAHYESIRAQISDD